MKLGIRVHATDAEPLRLRKRKNAAPIRNTTEIAIAINQLTRKSVPNPAARIRSAVMKPNVSMGENTCMKNSAGKTM